MGFRTAIATKLFTFAIALQVFNISLNQNDYLLGKMTNGVNYINEIETVVEFVLETCITGKDVIPETQVPGGTLGFEEEEKHLQERKFNFKAPYYSDRFYKKKFSHYSFNIKDHIMEVTTPPPRA